MIRGIHVLALFAIAVAAVAFRASAAYATRYQSLPVQDWLESRPPLAESAAVPAAGDLVRGLARTMPWLVILDDARPRLPSFGPPAYVQRTLGGVRDAARIEMGSPGQFTVETTPAQARFDVIVFNRRQRAAAWAQLMAREMDIRDPESGLAQARLSGPDEPEAVWVTLPRGGGGVATVSGSRGAVGFMLQVTYMQTAEPSGQAVDRSARAESVARAAAAEWLAWLDQQLGV